MSSIEIIKSDYIRKGNKEPQWEIWFYDNYGYVTITSNSKWKCKEDAEMAALKEMFDGINGVAYARACLNSKKDF